jgi:hypothetical protein
LDSSISTAQQCQWTTNEKPTGTTAMSRRRSVWNEQSIIGFLQNEGVPESCLRKAREIHLSCQSFDADVIRELHGIGLQDEKQVRDIALKWRNITILGLSPAVVRGRFKLEQSKFQSNTPTKLESLVVSESVPTKRESSLFNNQICQPLHDGATSTNFHQAPTATLQIELPPDRELLDLQYLLEQERLVVDSLKASLQQEKVKYAALEQDFRNTQHSEELLKTEVCRLKSAIEDLARVRLTDREVQLESKLDVVQQSLNSLSQSFSLLQQQQQQQEQQQQKQ